MVVYVYLIVAPGFDRVFVQTTPPTTLERTPGMKIYRAVITLPDVAKIDGRIITDVVSDETERLLGDQQSL